MALKAEAWRLEPARYPVRLSLQTRYADMDANAHLNNVAIARLVEESRVRFHRQLFGVRETSAEGRQRTILVAHVAIDYLAEGDDSADIAAGVAVCRIGTTSYTLGVGLFQHGRAIALANSVVVVRSDSGAIPADLHAKLRGLQPL